ncbi:MAG: DNA primase [candidate division KSB1 bacterium]|nr:DNA primase [candidate division KSB1 bacterium]MDZ7301427.1 DNA primase [candidate division KSB1 bacterium]MDZ7313459.1 DNA primase [candidate division KSB1 bacterium]
MSTIPNHIIDEVRLASDIVAVVSDYVTLRKSGRNFFGLCPFHPEKTPSFSVNPEKQIFHCFGCGAGGNVFTFIQRQQGISFPEAVRLLARRAGIAIPEPEAEDATAAQEKDALYFVNQMAAEFFQEMLFSEAGRPGREYMFKRGFNEEALRAFGIGYAPDSWDALTHQAQKKSVNLDVMVLAGLLNQRENKSGHYDRFRHRVMFPIYNLSGSVVAFGGRRIVDDESPKYLNSPETPIYHKGAILYGLYQGRDAVKAADRVIVVEGYLDLMRMHICGFQNAVATSGTALTEHQARLILRYTKNVTLLFDSDTAGQSATMRGADILVENGLAVSVATLSAGDDPDSFLMKHAAGEMQHILQNAPPLLEFKILSGAGVKSTTKDPIAQRTEQLRSIVETLARVQDGLERQTLVHSMAERLRVDEAVLWEEVSRMRRLQYPRARSRRPGEQNRGPTQSGMLSTPLPAAGQSYVERCRAAEEELIRIMILHGAATRFIFSFMRVDDFHDPEMRALAAELYKLLESGVLRGEGWHSDAETLLQNFTEPRQAEFVSQTLHSYVLPARDESSAEEKTMPEVDYRRWSADCMARLQRLKKEEDIQNLREQLKAREQSGGDVSELMQQFIEYQEQLKRIRPESFFE